MNRSTVVSAVASMIILCSILVSPVFSAEGLEKWPVTSSLLFAESLAPAGAPDDFMAPAVPMEKKQRSRGLDMGTAHTYMGYGTLVLALAAAFSSSNEDVHEPMGYAAAAAATLTCISGYMEYSDYFDTREGFSKYNVHIVSAVAATAGFVVTAILGADGDSHGGIGGASTVLMCVPIISLKW